MLILILIPATLLMAVWFFLLGQAVQEDWAIAAYNKVVDNRLSIAELRKKDEINREKLAGYRGVAAKVMQLLLDTGSDKKIPKLEKQNQALESGDLRSVSVLDIPGYVLQRKVERIGMGEVHKKLLALCTERYGKKYGVKKTRQLLGRLLSYPILGVSLSLILGDIMIATGDPKNGLLLMVVGTVIVLVLVYAQYDDVTDRLEKRRTAIGRQFPNVVSKMALLVTSGMTLDRAWRETADSQSGELYLEMRQTARELENLVPPAEAYTNFIGRCNTKETTKLASALIQAQTKGNTEIGILLKNLAQEAWQERRHNAKRDSEKANAMLLIPTMLLFMSILMMIMVPVTMSFSSF